MRQLAVLAALAFIPGICGFGGTISIVGSLDPNNPNDIFVYEFVVGVSGAATIQSWGYAGGVNAAGTTVPSGGFDAYLSLFLGTGPGAAFLMSDDDSGCPPAAAQALCRDPRLQLTGLTPGTYTLALTTFGNMSFAENQGLGSLGDGFVGMGSFADWVTGTDRSPAYAIDITTDSGAIPEPNYAPPLAVAALLLVLRKVLH